MDEEIDMNQAINLAGVTRQALSIAMKNGKLKYRKAHPNRNGRLYIKYKDLQSYMHNRYNRMMSKDEKGKLLFDRSKGIVSPAQAARALKIPAYTIYHLIYSRRISYERFKSSYILKFSEVKEIIDERRSQDCNQGPAPSLESAT